MRDVREATNKILEMIEEGLLDQKTVLYACLGAMSEADVAEMARQNEFFVEYEDDGQPDEAQEWESFDPDC